MENKLYSWLDDQISQGSTIDEHMIRENAKFIMHQISIQLNRDVEFKASSGWFHSWCARDKIRHVRRNGESLMVDYSTVEEFVKQFQEKITEGQYSADQIFNVDELGLWWKKRPETSYTTENNIKLPGPKPDKSRVTILVGKIQIFNH